MDIRVTLDREEARQAIVDWLDVHVIEVDGYEAVVDFPSYGDVKVTLTKIESPEETATETAHQPA